MVRGGAIGDKPRAGAIMRSVTGCGDVLPDGVLYHELRGDAVERAYPLVGEEAALVSRAVASRRQQYSAARHCARQVLAELGYPPVAILTGALGAPVWPDGVVGSITHMTGYCAAAATNDAAVRSVGIDAERRRGLPAEVLSMVASPEEQARLGDYRAANAVPWDTVLFSAKEAVYKAWFPLTGRWLGFHDVDLEIRTADGSFSARFLGEPLVVDSTVYPALEGRFGLDDELVVTAVIVPASGPV